MTRQVDEDGGCRSEACGIRFPVEVGTKDNRWEQHDIYSEAFSHDCPSLESDWCSPFLQDNKQMC